MPAHLDAKLEACDWILYKVNVINTFFKVSVCVWGGEVVVDSKGEKDVKAKYNVSLLDEILILLIKARKVILETTEEL